MAEIQLDANIRWGQPTLLDTPMNITLADAAHQYDANFNQTRDIVTSNAFGVGADLGQAIRLQLLEMIHGAPLELRREWLESQNVASSPPPANPWMTWANAVPR